MRVEAPSWLTSKKGARVRRQALRRIDAWSTLKFALLFFTSIGIVVTIMVMIAFLAADALGVKDTVEKLIQELGWDTWRMTTGGVLWFTSILSLAAVIIASGVSVSAVLLYNLIADLLGGVEFTVHDKDA
jgi:transmembrane protein DUF3566